MSMFKCYGSVTLQIKEFVCYSALHTFVCVWHYIYACVCLCVRLDGHGRQLQLHCSSSLTVINRHVSFPMVPSAWWRESSPWRVHRVGTSTPSLLTLCHMQECLVYISLRHFCICLHLFHFYGHIILSINSLITTDLQIYLRCRYN